MFESPDSFSLAPHLHNNFLAMPFLRDSYST